MSVLTRSEILKELNNRNDKNGLVITPLLNKGKEISSSAVDVHLGHEFIVFKRAKVTSIDIFDEELKKNVYQYQEKIRIGRKQSFILHPHQLVLGATIEYFSFPDNLCAQIVGRSTWGRTGLIIATAIKIDPCFKGCVTLELVNEGEVPLVLYPGLCVAQVIFMRTEGSAKYTSRYKCPTGPEFPKMPKEKEYLPLPYKPK